MPYCKHCIEDAANPNLKIHSGTNSKQKQEEAMRAQAKTPTAETRKFLKPKVTFSRRSSSKRQRASSNPFSAAAEKDKTTPAEQPSYDIWAAIDARAEKERAQKIAEWEKAEAELAKKRCEKRAEEERMFLEMEEKRRKATMLRIEEEDRKKKQDIFNSVTIHAADLGPGVKLIMVKGRYKVQVRVVPITVASLRQDACFVLENQKQLFVFHGSKANRMEKAKAIDLANRIKCKDHAGGGEVLFVADRSTKFWSLLGGKESDIDESVCEDSVEYERKEEEKVLIQAVVAGDDGKPVLQQLKPLGEKTRPSYVLCESSKVIVLSVGIEVYLWYGKKTTREMRAFGKDEAERLARENNALPVETLREGAELSVFCDKFCDWPGMLLINVNNQETEAGQKHHVREPYDVSALFRAIDARNESDDGLTPEDAARGTVSVWRVKDISKVAVPQELYGCFFSQHSYVVQHVFVADNGMKKTSVFFWQGRDCSYSEKASSALLAQDIFKEVSKRGEQVTQERVPQGKETDSFIMIFKGKLTILKGSAEGFKPQGTTVLRVFGEKYKFLHEQTTKEEPYHCLTLNQGFIVFQSDPMRSISFVDAETDEQEQAKALVTAFDKFIGVLLSAELHTETFSMAPCPEQTPSERMQAVLRGVPEWTFNALFTLPGDAQPIASQGSDDADALSASIPMHHRAMLVSCQGMNLGYVRGKPSQFDLDSKNFFFIRLGPTVYVWIGSRAPPAETRWVLAAALEFAKHEGMEEVLCINEMQEPKAFAAAFDDWEPLGSDALKQVPVSADTLMQTFFAFYSFEDLQANKIPGIDRTRLEDYLTEEDFEANFGMKKEEWEKIPEWKRVEKKKEMNFL